ncbi:MAG: DUF2339 domain-containing protein, partial [Pseudoxanthomonas sp.]
MDDLAGVLVLLGLAVLAVPILLIVALVSISGLKRRVSDLENEMRDLRTDAEPARTPVSPYASPAVAPATQEVAPEEPPVREPTLAELTRKSSVQEPAAPVRQADVPAPAIATPPLPPPLPAAPRVPPASPRPASAPPSTPDVFTVAARAVKRWFTVGNVPVKIGMLVLLAGVAALLKYASDQGW